MAFMKLQESPRLWAASKNSGVLVMRSLTCGLEIGVVGWCHADPQLVPGHVLLGDPGDTIHAGDEALHAGHEADARVLAIEAQQEPVTLAMS